jgi:hypothetical protein
MKLSKKEREFLRTMISLAQRALESASTEATPSRQRRSRAGAAELRRKVRAARRRNVPVRQIADELGITPSYVYQLLR